MSRTRCRKLGINRAIRFFISLFLRRNFWFCFVLSVWTLSYLHLIYQSKESSNQKKLLWNLVNDSQWIENLSQTERDVYQKCVQTYQFESVKGMVKASLSKETRWQNLPLSSDSFVMEIGGFHGNDMEQIVTRYNPKRYVVLEPILKHANKLLAKASELENVQVLNYGVGSKTGESYIQDRREASSLFHSVSQKIFKKVKVKILSVMDLFDLVVPLGQEKIDLLMMNCEGCEYIVLDYLFLSGLIKNVGLIQFQSHRIQGFEQEMLRKYCLYQHLFTRTHRKVYQFKYTWELWELIT